jgi:fido (protein-threonine AMPylation protein)
MRERLPFRNINGLAAYVFMSAVLNHTKRQIQTEAREEESREQH